MHSSTVDGAKPYIFGIALYSFYAQATHEAAVLIKESYFVLVTSIKQKM